MIYLLTFFEGIASFISPCLLPMIPIYISYFIGENKNDGKKAIINSIAFVLGFTFVFIILSIFASQFGMYISKYIEYLKIVFGIIIIILGLNYMDIIKIGVLNRTKIIDYTKKDLNFIKTFLFGIVFSISWTPCVGTFLSSSLLLIARHQDIYKGIILIIIYSLGLGIPFIISAALIDKMKKTFDFIKKNYNVIVKLSGIILIFMGIYILIS